jgi:hypothetical protein
MTRLLLAVAAAAALAAPAAPVSAASCPETVGDCVTDSICADCIDNISICASGSWPVDGEYCVG